VTAHPEAISTDGSAQVRESSGEGRSPGRAQAIVNRQRYDLGRTCSKSPKNKQSD